MYSVCRKVRESVIASVSFNVFHASSVDFVKVTVVPLYQHFTSTNNLGKSVLSVSTVHFLPSLTPVRVNPVMSWHIRKVLMSVNTICHICKVSPYIPLSVKTSAALVHYASHNVRHVQCQTCMSFKPKVSVTFNFKHVSLQLLSAILVAILFNTFSFSQPAKAILV